MLSKSKNLGNIIRHFQTELSNVDHLEEKLMRLILNEDRRSRECNAKISHIIERRDEHHIK